MTRKFSFSLSRKHFAVPYMAFLALFVIVPLVMLFVNAFMAADGSFTFANFAKFFTEKTGLLTFLESMLIGAITTVLCFFIGYPIAYILSNPKYNKTTVLIFLFILPMWINFLLRTIAMKELLEMLNVELGYGTILLGMVYDFLPFMILPIYTTLTNIDKSYVEASEDLGAKPMQVFFKTILPLSVPGIVSGVMMVFMPTMSSFVISDMMSNNTILLFGSRINRYFTNATDVSQKVGSAYSLILLIVIGITVLLSKKLNKNQVPAKGGDLW
ncbi:MAG: ABC transporter permease [Clostridiales bacterium]|jgi:spermidine/putrescine transport system permease protein|nr:ABC transporter permease [Clostridiales bacterium]